MTIAKYKAKEAITMVSSQYTKRSFLGIIAFIASVYGSQFVWIYLVLPGVARSGDLGSEVVIYIVSTMLWFYIVMNMVGGAMGGGLGIQDKDAHWIFTTGVTTYQYVWAHTVEYALFAIVFMAPLAFVPAVTLSTMGEPIWYMVLFPIGMTILILMGDTIASLITMGMKRGRKAVLITVYSVLIAITLLIINSLLAIIASPLLDIPQLDLLWDILPTTLIAEFLIGSMVGSFEYVPFLASTGILVALIFLVSWVARGYEYEYKPKITKERRYARKRMRDPLTSKDLLLIRRKKIYLYPLMTAAIYIAMGIFFSSSDGTMMPFFAAFLIMISSQTLTQQILINERMWILKSLGLSGKRVVLSMLKILVSLSIIYLPIAALLLIIGRADLWVLPGIFSIALMIPPYMIWSSLKFKKVGYMLSSFGSMAAVVPAITIPLIVPYYVSAPVLILTGAISYLIFSRLAAKKWDEIWEEIDFAAKFGQRVQNR